jgi:hypothetical protein
MISLKRLLIEATTGQAPGQLELIKSKYEDVVSYSNKIDLDLDELNNFKDNYLLARKMANYGKTQRKDMPVINTDDVWLLQKLLKNGSLDIHKPFSDETNKSNPFPEGLSGKEAEEFLKRGFKDNHKTDDIIKYSVKNIPVSKLKPIQKQIYVDKSLSMIKRSGVETFTKHLENETYFITSTDNYIIDGHHRYLAGMLMDKNISVRCLVIDLPISKLLPLALAFGDAIGNKRNM